MRKLFVIGIDVVIVALIVGSLVSGTPMWSNAQTATNTLTAHFQPSR
jgi:hypothetical protein